MLEREIDEDAFNRRQGEVKSAGNRMFRECQRFAIRCKGARRAAEDIARKLVEQENQGQCASWFTLPVIEFACVRTFVIGKKTRSTCLVEDRVRYEPYSPLASRVVAGTE